MSALKMAVMIAVKNTAVNGFSAARNTGLVFKYGNLSPCISSIQARFLSSQDITKNIQYISNEKINLEKDPETLKLVKPIERPLCIMLNWMLAKQKNIHKYAKLYLEQGYDVLSVSCTPWQLLWPMKGSQLVAGDLLKFMESNSEHKHLILHCFSIGGYVFGELLFQASQDKKSLKEYFRLQLVAADTLRFIESNTAFAPLVIHGFSIGGYMWGEVCFIASGNKPRYQPVLDRVAAQIWDSAADISELPIGVPKAIFPKNQVMQNALHKYIIYHMKTFHESATVHYMRSSQQFHLNLCRAPALFLLSKTDPVGAEASNRRVHDSWKSIGIQTTWKCWDRSPHVSHYRYHTSEYLTLMSDHLESLDLLSQPEKIRARI